MSASESENEEPVTILHGSLCYPSLGVFVVHTRADPSFLLHQLTKEEYIIDDTVHGHDLLRHESRWYIYRHNGNVWKALWNPAGAKLENELSPGTVEEETTRKCSA